MKDYSKYTVTVKRDESNYGDVTREQAHAIADHIATELAALFPGITIRYCDLIGVGHQDATTGPNESICLKIDEAAFNALQAALEI